MKILEAVAVLGLITVFASGDTILENAGAPTFAAVPALIPTPLMSSNGNATPYWDNTSSDCGVSKATSCNIENYLTATGGFSAGTNYNPSQYLSGPGSGGANDAPAAFNLVHTTNSLIISLLAINTGGHTDTFGIYNASLTGGAATASEIPLFTSTGTPGSSANESAPGFTNIGFYLTDGAGAAWFSNSALNVAGPTGDPAGHQHFVLFTTASDPNTFYLGVTDWATGNGGEGNGDYNDLIIEINASAVPEPASFVLVGAGLLGFGYIRLRARRG